MVSVAVAVAVVDNLRRPRSHGRATLDGLRATRVISDVSYPFLTRFDQYIPLSWGELVDSIRNEGYDSVLKYVNTTLGLKDSFFNTLDDEHVEGRQDRHRRLGHRARAHEHREGDRRVAGVRSTRTSRGARPTTRTTATPRRPATDPDGLEGEQAVSIEATNYQQFINMVGIFSLPDIDLDAKGAKFKDRISLSPAGTAGSKGGVGGAVLHQRPGRTRRTRSSRTARRSTAAPTAAST